MALGISSIIKRGNSDTYNNAINFYRQSLINMVDKLPAWIFVHNRIYQ